MMRMLAKAVGSEKRLRIRPICLSSVLKIGRFSATAAQFVDCLEIASSKDIRELPSEAFLSPAERYQTDCTRRPGPLAAFPESPAESKRSQKAPSGWMNVVATSCQNRASLPEMQATWMRVPLSPSQLS